MVKVEPGETRNWDSTGTYAMTTFTVNLDSIDPNTGAVRHLKTFSSKDTHSCSSALDGMKSTKRRALMDFSADFSKMAAILTLEDGSEHVGWIDENGIFTDVSQKVTPDAGDFGALTKHANPCFGPNNYFYFRDNTDSDSLIKRVSLDNLTPSAVETMAKGNNFIYPLPDGNISSYCWDYYDETMTYPARWDYDFMTDWISSNECVGKHRTQDKDMIYKYTLSGVEDIFDKWYSELTPLVPSIKGRTNWNPIVSPDKSKVAFLSKLTTGTDQLPYLYIVPINGGNPVKVVTDYAFNDYYLWFTYLLTWDVR